MSGNREINYTYYHWGPFLYKTSLTTDEVNEVKKLCSKNSTSAGEKLAGLIEHEYKVEVEKLFPIINPYLQSYARAYKNYTTETLGNKIELKSAWVNYMTKFESNPLHTHIDDLSFVLFTQVPKGLLQENNNLKQNKQPGCLNFMYVLEHKKLLINKHTFFPKEGDFFIFPACLHHYVNSFKCEGERISVSGNLKITE